MYQRSHAARLLRAVDCYQQAFMFVRADAPRWAVQHINEAAIEMTGARRIAAGGPARSRHRAYGERPLGTCTLISRTPVGQQMEVQQASLLMSAATTQQVTIWSWALQRFVACSQIPAARSTRQSGVGTAHVHLCPAAPRAAAYLRHMCLELACLVAPGVSRSRALRSAFWDVWQPVRAGAVRRICACARLLLVHGVL